MISRRKCPVLIALVLSGLWFPVAPSVHAAETDIDAAVAAAWRGEFGVTALEAVALALPPEAGKADAWSFDVPLGDAEYRLTLERHSIRSASFRFFVQDEFGDPVETEAPEVRTYRGTVEGRPDARVRATWTDHGIRAVIVFDRDDVWYVRPIDRGTIDEAFDHVVYRAADQVLPENWCGTRQAQPEADLQRSTGSAVAESGGPTMFLTEIALDADHDFYQIMGEDVIATTAHVEGSINDLIVFFERDLQITYEVTAVVVRTTSPDPYNTSGDSGQMLSEFRNHWNNNHQGIRKDVAQLYTGRNMDARGIAWLSAVCGSNRYSVVRGDDSAVDFVAGHELGHNWGAPHCTGDDCFIMCSGGPCPGGRAFGPGSQSVIFAFRNTIQGCLGVAGDPLAVPFVETFPQSTLDPAKWFFSRGASVTTAASNEPTAPFSLGLTGTGSIEGFDEAQTRALALDGASEDVFVSYRVQADGLDEGDRILVDYMAAPNDWAPLPTIFPNSTTSNHFSLHYHILPPNATHDRFRLRFRSVFDDADDRLYVDNVCVALSDASVDLVQYVGAVRAGQTFRFDAHVTNETSASNLVTAWVDFVKPDGSPLFASNPKLGPKTVNLNPDQTKSRLNIRVRVPLGTPPNTGYRAIACTGVFPDEIHHVDSLVFQVTEP